MDFKAIFAYLTSKWTELSTNYPGTSMFVLGCVAGYGFKAIVG